MTTIESPGALISQTCTGWNTASDIEALLRIRDTIKAVEIARNQKLNDAHDNLKALIKQHDALNIEFGTCRNTTDDDKFATQLISLDKSKFGLAKTLNELERNSLELSATVEGLKNFLSNERGTPVLPTTDVSVILQLKIFRDLGLEVDMDANGSFQKVTVSSRSKHEVYQFPVDHDESLNPFEFTNSLWEKLG